MRAFGLVSALAGLGLMALAACSDDAADGDAETASPPQITVSDARMRTPPGGRDISAAYFTVQNAGGADRLLAVSLSVAERTELHATVVENDRARMVEQEDGVEVPASGALSFEPGGLHVMAFGVQDGLSDGDAAEMTLSFERAGEITVETSVVDDPTRVSNGEHANH